MARPITAYPSRHSRMGRRFVRALLIAVIMLMTIGPGFGGGDSGPDQDSGGGCGGSDTYSDEVYAEFQDSDFTIEAGGYTDPVTGDSYIAHLLGGASNRTDLRLPGYTYFQGIIQADKHLTVAGQVRIVGALLGADAGTCSLYNGAMITTNAHALIGAGEALNGMPEGIRTRIRTWEEIPAP